MKKYRTINFLEKDKKDNKKSKLYNIAIIISIIYLGSKIYYSLNEIQSLESYIKENNIHESLEIIPVMSYEEFNTVDISKIQEIYNRLGKNNIMSLIINDSNIEIEGKCVDLNILNTIKDYEFIKEMSINKIKKEGEAYMFNVSYRVCE